MLDFMSSGKPVKELLRLKIINSNGLYRSANLLGNFPGPSSAAISNLNNNNNTNNAFSKTDYNFNFTHCQELAENEIFIKDEQHDALLDSANFILPDYSHGYNDVNKNPTSPPSLNIDDYILSNSSTSEKFSSKNLILLYCQHCNRTFKKQYNVKQSTCEICDRSIQFQCVNCDRRYNHQRSAITHVKLECRNRLGFGCVLCDFRTNHRKGLVAHIENAHAAYDPNKAVTCEQCKKVYKNYKNLRKHQLIDCGKMPTLQCDHCNYKSNYKSRIREHIKCRHMMDFKEMHICSKCGKTYKTASYFRKHEAFLCKKIVG